MPKFAANLTMLFTEYDFLDRFERAAKAGFKGVEYLFPYPYKVEDLVQRLQANELAQVLHNLPAGDWGAGERGIACLPDRVGEFQDGVGKAIEYATALKCPLVNCLAGIAPGGVDQTKLRDTFVGNIKYAADELKKHNIKLLIEPINTMDIPGFYLTRTNQAIELIDQTGSDNIFVQYDVYHMQIMEGDLARTVEKNLSPDRPYPACRQSGPQRAGHGRNQLPVPVRPLRPHRLRRLDRLRVQAERQDRRRPRLVHQELTRLLPLALSVATAQVPRDKPAQSGIKISRRERKMKVGFIGLGIMGRPMAGHLIDAGHELFLYDVKPVPTN